MLSNFAHGKKSLLGLWKMAGPVGSCECDSFSNYERFMTATKKDIFPRPEVKQPKAGSTHEFAKNTEHTKSASSYLAAQDILLKNLFKKVGKEPLDIVG